MVSGYLMRARTRRFLMIICATLIYLLLLTVDALHFFPHYTTTVSSQWFPWVSFGASAFIAAMFLAVGSLIWLYARNRPVAWLIFYFCLGVMISFVLETAAGFNDTLLLPIAAAGALLALTLFSVLLLVFPRNYLSLYSQATIGSMSIKYSNRRRYFLCLLYGYVALISLIAVLATIYSFLTYWFSLPFPTWLTILNNAYNIVVPVGILITIIILYFRSSSSRERQQLRLFVYGVIFTVAPFLVLTVLPEALNWPFLDSQLSTLTIGLFPLALGYTILRYQVLVFDKYIRRAVVLIVRGIGLVIVSYLIFTLANVTLSSNVVAQDIVIIVAMIVLVPLVLWGGKVVTDYLFFKEVFRYRRLIGKADAFEEEAVDLDEAARLLTLAAVNAFETQEICLFVIDITTGYYCIAPALKEGEQDEARNQFVQRLRQSLKQSTDEQAEEIEGLDAKGGYIQRLDSAKRPLFLREVCAPEGQMPTGLARYLLIPSSSDGVEDEHTEPLLAPIRVQGKMIAFLALGERGDHQQYAGPDFEILEYIFNQYSSVLETSRLMVELRAAYERQKELDKLKDRFIMTASHELRTPLTAVQGYIELLKEYSSVLGPEKVAEFITKANRGCDELTLMVNNIMDASRVEFDTQTLQLQPVSLFESVKLVVEIFEAVTTREERTVHIDVAPSISVLADSVRLRQVLMNLISNAFKYSPKGSTVNVSCKVEDEQVTVCVQDFGFGVPLEHQDYLFERFVRLERDMNSPTRGAGLGLYICKQLVKAMGGRIWVESSGKLNSGSLFAFTLQHAVVNNEMKKYALGHSTI